MNARLTERRTFSSLSRTRMTFAFVKRDGEDETHSRQRCFKGEANLNQIPASSSRALRGSRKNGIARARVGH
jgi:hypothetical protein